MLKTSERYTRFNSFTAIYRYDYTLLSIDDLGKFGGEMDIRFQGL